VFVKELHEFGAERLDVGVKGQLHSTPLKLAGTSQRLRTTSGSRFRGSPERRGSLLRFRFHTHL
jgi:hypothetical protein